ncbi:MAG: butyrate kinase [Tissierellia bacterium]|nr:butyrate kinase [Tissierellia bacterium]
MENRKYKILAINPGSTSTKIAVFLNEQILFRKTIDYTMSKLSGMEVPEQYSFRKQDILFELEKAKIKLKNIDVFVGRGGGQVPLKSGTYEINEKLLEHGRIGIGGGNHPAQLAAQICDSLRNEYGGRAFVVNPPDVDEFDEIARITGIKDVYRASRIHALNQKEVAHRFCLVVNKNYKKINLIIVHVGGGISITAHREGRMIDSNDILQGDGPMTPTRCGSIAVGQIIDLCYSRKYTKKYMKDKTTTTGGFVDLLGTADMKAVEQRIQRGDSYAKLMFDAMIYQIGKSIGSCAVVLKGNVYKIILTGSMVKSEYLVKTLKEYTEWIAPSYIMAGEFEMEALAAGALRVLMKKDEPIEYTGIPVWSGVNKK